MISNTQLRDASSSVDDIKQMAKMMTVNICVHFNKVNGEEFAITITPDLKGVELLTALCSIARC